MLIGELARRTGVGTHTLRYYESQGLLRPERGSNGYRVFTTDAIRTVVQVRGLLQAGLSTREIAYLLPCASGDVPLLEPCSELVSVLESRREQLDLRLEALVRSRAALQRYLEATAAATSTAGAGSECARAGSLAAGTS